MMLPNYERPHGFQELDALTSNKTHPELFWTKLGININPCKNWFVTWIDILLSEIGRMRCEKAYPLVLYHLKVTFHEASKLIASAWVSWSRGLEK
jgi:hypothetical protein